MNKFSRLALLSLLLIGASAAWAQKPALLERGKYLMGSVVACGNCHVARGDKGQPLFEKGLSGGMVFDDVPFKAVAANITPDRDTGIGQWTDAQLAKAIREGVRPDKSIIGPPMPIEFYRHMSEPTWPPSSRIYGLSRPSRTPCPSRNTTCLCRPITVPPWVR